MGPVSVAGLRLRGNGALANCLFRHSRAAPVGQNLPMSSPAARLVIALAQIAFVVGDISGNRDRLRQARAEAAAFGADLVMTPELYLAGYPPEDLVLKPAFQEACRAACDELARDTADGGPAILVGLPWVEEGRLHNAMALLDRGRIEAVRFKVDLPNYGVFDEKRVFVPGPSPGPIVFNGARIGTPICEDIWGPDPVECILETGGEILLVANASPYERDKLLIRQNVAVTRVVESGLPLIYLNMVGGQDEIVFEGASFGLNADRGLAFQLPAFRPVVARTVWERGETELALCRGAARGGRGGRRGRLCGLRAGTARLCREQPLSWRGARPLGRGRLGALRGDGGRRARRRARPCGDAALPFHLERIPLRRRLPAPRRWASATTSCRSPSRSRASSTRLQGCSPAGGATSPRRTSRAARAV